MDWDIVFKINFPRDKFFKDENFVQCTYNEKSYNNTFFIMNTNLKYINTLNSTREAFEIPIFPGVLKFKDKPNFNYIIFKDGLFTLIYHNDDKIAEYEIIYKMPLGASLKNGIYPCFNNVSEIPKTTKEMNEIMRKCNKKYLIFLLQESNNLKMQLQTLLDLFSISQFNEKCGELLEKDSLTREEINSLNKKQQILEDFNHQAENFYFLINSVFKNV